MPRPKKNDQIIGLDTGEITINPKTGRPVNFVSKPVKGLKEPHPDYQPVLYGYVRVSTLKQVQGGLSLDYQEGAIKKYFEYLESKLEVGQKMPIWGGIFRDEAETSWKLGLVSRPQGWNMHRQLKCGDHVVIARLDRGFRSLRDLNRTLDMWRGAGIRVHLLDIGGDMESPTGKMFVQFAGMMAEFESHTKSERQHLHNKMWKAEGNRSVTEWGYTTKIYLRDGKERRVTRLNHRQVAAMRYLHWLLFTKLKSYGTAAELLTENLRRRVTEGREVDSRLLKRCPLGRFDVAKLIIKLPLIYPDRGYHSGRRKSGIAIKSLRYVR